MAQKADPVRLAAVQLLHAVLDEKLALTELTGEDGPLGSLSPAERARAQRLVVSTLRHMGRADAVIKPLLRKHPPEDVLLVLRLAIVEMLEEGSAPHGVVNAAVNLLRLHPRTAPLGGLANAVLRKASTVTPDEWAALTPTRMAGWLRGRLESKLGRAGVLSLEVAHAAGAPLDLTPKGDAQALAEQVGGEALPTGSVRVQGSVQVSALPGYDTGDWWVQDAAAAIPARVLDAKPGEAVADICAAPGGKTMQLAATGADVTALDISGPRLERLRENLTRTGLTANVVKGDFLHWQAGPFDAILLDAPCSATGTLRRHPDLPHVRSGKDIKPLFDLQAQMIDRALTLLKPGGRMVYCTCSLLPEEGEDQIAAALERHPGLVVEPADLAGLEPGWTDAQGGLRLRPDYWSERGGMDGFYIARLRKPA
ncbi:RsmB/NOP family class I SAM-dependent RNA methyltransferase [Actibacterium sp. XHP0104]|uniref:RsmB/NOP family class I SAM-dependent RNA methyltransferase n=1 Tax=Actibacterium sp. XHP0104 TaxID=2984335 RepID=UPI0021E826EA|nr:transcription antitermination factor NusB [Actibacterium sp. XHP0104]MCV2881925.1 methyltransferase domain-containing protein [Actibacterium sp. XHP0104]